MTRYTLPKNLTKKQLRAAFRDAKYHVIEDLTDLVVEEHHAVMRPAELQPAVMAFLEMFLRDASKYSFKDATAKHTAKKKKSHRSHVCLTEDCRAEQHHDEHDPKWERTHR